MPGVRDTRGIGGPGFHEKLADAVSVAATTDRNDDLATVGFVRLLYVVRMTGAAAAGDLANVECRLYEPDGTTLVDIVYASEASVAPTLVGSVVYALARYQLGGATKVQLRARNASAAARTLHKSIFLERA